MIQACRLIYWEYAVYKTLNFILQKDNYSRILSCSKKSKKAGITKHRRSSFSGGTALAMKLIY
jgi:hypothetical protein